MNIRYFALGLIAAAVLSCTSEQRQGTLGAGEEIDRKVEDLLSRMTLQEKIGQMNQISAGGEVAPYAAAVREGKVGSILNEVDPLRLNEFQRIAVEESRLGIPILVGRDIIHGYRTVFPIPLGIAATFDPELARTGAALAAAEARPGGIHWTFSPMLDIARDPRWGRIAEGSGEDPYLDACMAEAFVRGYQGERPGASSLAACIKHFAGYGAAEGGRDYAGTQIPERQLRNVYLPPFEAAVKAGAMTLMTSFNENDGLPSTGNVPLVRGILRDEWGFDGLVVTDWNSMGEMIAHGFATDRKEAARQALEAGVDMDMMTFGFLSHLEELLKEGKVRMADIDEAVRHILKVKYMLGLFDNPYVDPAAAKAALYTEEALSAARRTVAESAILLKNDGVLPLKGVRTLLVTGPMADAPHDQLGTWCFDGEKDRTVTPLQALREQFGGNVLYVPGLAYTREVRTSFPEVLAAARKADAVLAFVGEEAILSGEAHSLADLNLIGSQSDLLKALKATGKPVIAVVMAGRPLTIERDLPSCNALLYSFHPGTMGGPGLADLLLGKTSPSGKTPVTFLRTVGQVPMYYNHHMSGRPYQNEKLLSEIGLEAGQTSLGNTSYYLDYGACPLFPFGFGLSYTNFVFSDISLDRESYGKDDVIRVSYTLSNTGTVEATEVVQVYVRDLVGSVVRPVRELKAFGRVTLAPGERKALSFEIPVSRLAFYGRDGKRAVEPGGFLLWVAGDSATGEPVHFEVR
ncbi:MAG: glycoside hydrolase family 3 C-terminal domain-containing protein [Bacteroidales bacterium]|nr:glycoside hydrolase family 3 C-terminal domain-containing protein [Bacteroidales bacterium]